MEYHTQTHQVANARELKIISSICSFNNFNPMKRSNQRFQGMTAPSLKVRNARILIIQLVNIIVNHFRRLTRYKNYSKKLEILEHPLLKNRKALVFRTGRYCLWLPALEFTTMAAAIAHF